jgi:enoyl-CoA hydratase/carnithine racemase
MVDMIMALATSIKPIVCVVRGAAIGIGFTLTAHTTFLYCSPEATFMTPFMRSAQSPEGTSTLLFPKQFGTRLANEILLTDKTVTAQEALKVGYINGIIDSFDPKSDEVDPNKIPVINKLLKTDLKTLSNCMEQINMSKNIKEIEKVTKREG